MSLTLIQGKFRVVGASPDGDSVRFYPDDPDAFKNANIKAQLNAHGGAQLRLDGIDALETHYHGWRQQVKLGEAAAAALLTRLGFTDVQRNAEGTVTSSTPDETSGFILTRFADKYGRAVAFTFSGEAPDFDPEKGFFLDVAQLKKSANYGLLEDGLVYPTFYSKLYVDLRNAMAQAAVDARTAGKGIWELDVTNAGFELASRDQLQNELVILPKLFRRLVDYLMLDETGGVSLNGFEHFLETRDDRLFTVPAGHSTEFSTLIDVQDQRLRLTVNPEQIVFIEA